MRTDPSDTGGMFLRRRPGTAPVRYRAVPEQVSARRQAVDRTLALVLAGVMVVVNLAFWGPIPAGWLWVTARVQYLTGNVALALLVGFTGMTLTLLAALVALKRLDDAWILVRRSAGRDQRKGILVPVFAATCAVGAVAFTFWLVFIGGLGSMAVPGRSF